MPHNTVAPKPFYENASEAILGVLTTVLLQHLVRNFLLGHKQMGSCLTAIAACSPTKLHVHKARPSICMYRCMYTRILPDKTERQCQAPHAL